MRRAGVVVLALLTLLPMAVVVVHAVVHLGRQPLFSGDYAFLELSTRSASRGQALLGAYSRFGWDHPGPLAFYWYAPFYVLAGQHPEGLGLGALILNVVCLGGVVAIARRVGGHLCGWGAAGVVLLFLRISGLSWLDRPWNPVAIIAPVAVVGVLGAAAVAGRRWALPLMVLAASFAVQTHVGTVPAVGAMTVGLLALTAWRWRTAKVAAGRPILAAAVVAVVVWTLPVYEQLTDRPGNITEMVRFTRKTPVGHHSLGQVLGRTGEQLTLSRLGLIPHVLASNPTPAPISGRQLTLVIALALGVAVALWRNVRRQRWFPAGLCVAGLCGSAGVIIGCSRVVGKLYGHVSLSATAVGLILWLAVVTTVATEIEAIPKRSRARRPLRVAGRLAALGLVGLSIYLAQHAPKVGLFAPGPGDPVRVRAVDRVRRETRHARSVLIDPLQNDAVSTSALFANQLERHGVVVHSRRSREYEFGRERRADGCEDLRLVVTAPGGVAPPTGSRSVATLGRFSISVVHLRPDC